MGQKSIIIAIVDIIMILLISAEIVTGFILHKELWHLHLYNDKVLWAFHETVGIILLILIGAHCLQHSFWFRNYAKIRVSKKWLTTILLLVGIIAAITGIILMCGSQSEVISHTHYIGAILFTLIALIHTSKRWKLLTTRLTSQRK